jgi:mRNA interferase MazF
MMAKPSRGEIWLVDLNPTIGHEEAGNRPALVVSVDELNQSAAKLAIILPITSRAKGIRSHVEIPKGEAGLKLTSYVKCEDIRSVSTQRLSRPLGVVSQATMDTTEDTLRILLGL